MLPKLHVALNVNNLEESMAFYRALWGAEPVKIRTGYAKFDVDEPGVNLTLNENKVNGPGGINHFGIQVGSTEAVEEMRRRLEERGLNIVLAENNVSCCYAVQDKVWVQDPNGYRWEVFVVLQDNLPEVVEQKVDGCCATFETDQVVSLGSLSR